MKHGYYCYWHCVCSSPGTMVSSPILKLNLPNILLALRHHALYWFLCAECCRGVPIFWKLLWLPRTSCNSQADWYYWWKGKDLRYLWTISFINCKLTSTRIHTLFFLLLFLLDNSSPAVSYFCKKSLWLFLSNTGLWYILNW